jgi:hypothetical protein
MLSFLLAYWRLESVLFQSFEQWFLVCCAMGATGGRNAAGLGLFPCG